MLLKLILFAVIGLASAGFAIVGWVGLQGSTPSAEAVASAPPKTRTVLVAAAQLSAGSLIKPENIASAEMPIADLKPGAWPDSPTARGELVGAMIRRSLSANEVILPTEIMRPGDHGFLAAVLGAGERAVSVGVDAVSGTAGLIWPGDTIDLILTQQIDDPATPIGHRISGETVLRNVRVIAIDQQLVHGTASSASENIANRTVTLEVSPDEAERVSVAIRLGKLSLIVVAAEQTPSRDEAGKPAPQTITWGGDVSTALRQGPTGDGKTVRVFHGSADSKEFRF